MKKQLLPVLILLFSINTFGLPKNPKPVPYVDLAMYMGDWYQIAHVPMFYENYKCACVKQRMSSRADGQFDVSLSCNKSNAQGDFKVLNGVARNDDPQSNAKFTIDFDMAINPSVWIVGLDSQYRYAVISDGSGTTLHIMSRSPGLDGALYNEAVAIADEQNLSTSRLEMTDHRGCQYP